MPVIVVSNPKGGVHKSTLARHSARSSSTASGRQSGSWHYIDGQVPQAD